MPSKSDAAQDKNRPYCTDISKVGKFRNIISGTRGEGKYEVHPFRQELRQKINSGTLNVAEMAKEAPDHLKARAEKIAVELEDVLNQWENKGTAVNERHSTMLFRSCAMGRYHSHRYLHGPHNAESHNGFLSSMSPEDRAEMHAFRQDVRQAIQDETFNAEELAAKAPAKLKASGLEKIVSISKKH